METRTVKSDIWTLIEKIEDVEILEAIKTFIQNFSSETDFWDQLPEFQKQSIERGLQQAADGETIPHEKVMKKYEKWLSK
jgi:predicted transcriptional regulator